MSAGNRQHLLVVEEKKMRNGLRRDKETGGLDQGNPGPEPGFSGSPLSGDTMVIARDFLSLLYFSYHPYVVCIELLYLLITFGVWQCHSNVTTILALGSKYTLCIPQPHTRVPLTCHLYTFCKNIVMHLSCNFWALLGNPVGTLQMRKDDFPLGGFLAS